MEVKEGKCGGREWETKSDVKTMRVCARGMQKAGIQQNNQIRKKSNECNPQSKKLWITFDIKSFPTLKNISEKTLFIQPAPKIHFKTWFSSKRNTALHHKMNWNVALPLFTMCSFRGLLQSGAGGVKRSKSRVGGCWSLWHSLKRCF